MEEEERRNTQLLLETIDRKLEAAGRDKRLKPTGMRAEDHQKWSYGGTGGSVVEGGSGGGGGVGFIEGVEKGEVKTEENDDKPDRKHDVV